MRDKVLAQLHTLLSEEAKSPGQWSVLIEYIDLLEETVQNFSDPADGDVVAELRHKIDVRRKR
jgi:hypothetical protein